MQIRRRIVQRGPAAALALAWLLGACSGGRDEEPPETSRPADVRPEAEPTPAGPVSGHLVLILDTSGSMRERVQGEGRSRFEIARDVLLDEFVPLIADDLTLALCVFKGSGPRPLTALVRAGDFVKPKWRHKEWVMEQIEQARPEASTPIVDSLEWAQGALGRRQGPRIVVLITDGEETERPREVGTTLDRLRGDGIDLYAIGFNIAGGGKVLAQRLGPRYIEATGGRDALLGAMRQVLAAIER
jgi:Mg-chelatase subunit ChlD